MVFLPQLSMGTGEKGVLIANFDIEGAGIKPNLKETIYWKQFLRIAGQNKSKWRIEGFSDCQGKESRNGSLRERRAKAVLGLLPAGLKGSITETGGASPGECITDNTTAADRTLNRSVAIFLVESTHSFKGDDIEGKVETKEPGTSGCTDDQRKRLAVAYPLAKRLGENAMSAISRMTRGSPEETLLKKFFGAKAYDERWHIKQKYAAAVKTIKIGPTYRCVKTGTGPCKDGTVGYVGAHAIITGNPTIVCENAFADDNIELADTILHEASHLGAWTNDHQYCYRSTGCNLDTTDEAVPGIGVSDRGALNNADSYGRFASELFRL